MTKGVRPMELVPRVEIGDDRHRFEYGYRFLVEQFAEMKDEIERLRRHISDLRDTIQEISVDGEMKRG